MLSYFEIRIFKAVIEFIFQYQFFIFKIKNRGIRKIVYFRSYDEILSNQAFHYFEKKNFMS